MFEKINFDKLVFVHEQFPSVWSNKENICRFGRIIELDRFVAVHAIITLLS